LRDGAGLLALASESNADREVIVKAARVVEAESALTAKTSTQEESWMALAAKPVTIINRGQAPARVSISVSGRPTLPEPAEEHGYKIERSFFRLDGTPVEPNAIRQNDRLVVALKITELEAAYARLILVDRLPAGIEIDNPDLFD